MTQEIVLWRIQDDGQLKEIEGSTLDLEKRLEAWIEEDISMISDDLLTIGKQVKTDFGGKIDLLCIDRIGDLAIVELKRNKTPRDITAQTLDYASWVNALTGDNIADIATGYLNEHGYESLESAFEQRFDIDKMPDELNRSHSMLIVATQIDPASERIIDYLSSTYEVAINAVTFQCFKDGGDEYIARIFLIEPAQQPEAIKTPRHRIMPKKGEFDEVELENRLKDTLSQQTRLMPKFICFLKLLLSEDRVFGREEIKKEFLDKNISANERQAGIHLTNVSAFITNPSNSHLQQIIDFEWIGGGMWVGGGMKDNYKINPKYRDLVASVVNGLKENV